MVRITLVATLLAAGACGDSGSGTFGDTTSGADSVAPGGACRTVGPAIALPSTWKLDIATTSAGTLLVVGDGASGETYVVGETEATPSSDAPVAASTQFNVVPDGAAIHVVSLAGAWAFDGLPFATWDGTSWTSARSDPLGTSGVGVDGLAVAPDGAGGADVFWFEGIQTQTFNTVRWDGSSFTAATPVGLDLGGDIDGREAHAAYATDGSLHLKILSAGPSGRVIVHGKRDPSGTWSAATTIGDAPDSLGNTTVTGLAAGPNGAVWVAEVRSASPATQTDGAMTAYRVDGTPTEVGRVADDRLVVQGLDTAVLSDGRLLVSASWGDNNLDFAASDDSVLLYACQPTGGCGVALALDERPGVFYEGTSIATDGLDGVAAWAWETKGMNSQAGVTVQRFTCAR